MRKNDKILITGSTGLLGSALVKNLRDKKFKKLILINSKKINLTNLNSIKRLLLKQKPKYIFHCANKVFGFGGNQSNKFEMLNENLLINSNLLKAVLVTKVKKILFVGSTAVYNEKLKYNISEDKIFYRKPHSSEYKSIKLLEKKFKYLTFSTEKISKALKFCFVTVSFSSTVIEDSLNSKIPVILFDRWKRYKHCDSESNPYKKNSAVYYLNTEKDFVQCIKTIKLSNKINKPIKGKEEKI